MGRWSTSNIGVSMKMAPGSAGAVGSPRGLEEEEHR
jgi:hypothetical protein